MQVFLNSQWWNKTSETGSWQHFGGTNCSIVECFALSQVYLIDFSGNSRDDIFEPWSIPKKFLISHFTHKDARILRIIWKMYKKYSTRQRSTTTIWPHKRHFIIQSIVLPKKWRDKQEIVNFLFCHCMCRTGIFAPNECAMEVKRVDIIFASPGGFQDFMLWARRSFVLCLEASCLFLSVSAKICVCRVPFSTKLADRLFSDWLIYALVCCPLNSYPRNPCKLQPN